MAVAALNVATLARAADPTTVDCITAYEKSIKARNEGRLRDARSELLTCAVESCPADVRNECARRISEVNASVPTIVFEAKDQSGGDLSNVKVSMDGQLLVEHLQGTALSIDPGVHTFRFEAEGIASVEKKYVIAQGQKDRREIVVLGAEAMSSGAPSPGPLELTAAPAPGATASTLADEPKARPTQRILGWTAIGAGAVGVTLGVVFAAKRWSTLSDRDAICAGDSACPAGSQARVDALTEDARAAGTASAVGFVAGGLLAAGGVVLLFTAPEARHRVGLSPSVSPTFVGLTLRSRAW